MSSARRAVVAGVLLCIGAVLCGCSDSSSGGKSSTASGSSGQSSGVGGPTPSAPIVSQYSMNQVAPASAARQQQAMLLLNQQLQELWDRIRPEVVIRMQNEADALVQQGQLNYQNGPVTAGILKIDSLTLDALTAPGLTELNYNRLELHLPLQGTWRITADTEIGLQLQFGSFGPALALPVTLDIILSADAEVDIDDSDPTRPEILSSNNPQVQFTVTVSSSDPLVNQYLPYLNQVAQPLVQTALQLALGYLVAPGLVGFPGDVWADGAPPVQDSGQPVPFEEVARNVERKIIDDHSPHGLINRVMMDTPVDDESWMDAYVDSGPQNTGSVVSVNGLSDSAIHTGYLMTALALRWASTGDQEALDHLRFVMSGVNALLEVNGNSGLLARAAAPVGSMVGQRIVTRGAFVQTPMRGDVWAGWQSDKGVSRDQYTGIFFGLMAVHELSGDPAMQADCEARIAEMLDYMIRKDWVTTEDRPHWTDAGNEGTPLMWKVQGIYQQINFLMLGERLHPGRYAAELQKLEGLAPMTWLSTWFSTTGLSGYFKFNLQMLNAYSYFRYETDQRRWMEMARAYRIIQRWIGHHQNPHYDTIQCAIDPSLQPTLFPGVREQLRQFLTRNHRDRVPPGLDLSVIQWADFDFADPTDPSGVRTKTLPTEPVPVPLRDYTGYYLWQKEPVRPAIRNPNNWGAYAESTGLDLILPYWMGRWYGAF